MSDKNLKTVGRFGLVCILLSVVAQRSSGAPSFDEANAFAQWAFGLGLLGMFAATIILLWEWWNQ